MNLFTRSAQEALPLARREAARFHHPSVCTEHLLLGLIALDDGVVVNVLKKMGIKLSAIQQEIEKQVRSAPSPKKALSSGEIPYTPRFKKALALAGKEAKALNHRFISTHHLLLGLIREGDGVAAHILTNLGVDLERARLEVIKEIDGPHEEAEIKSPIVASGEADLIRQELAVLKSRVETISQAVDEASQRSRPPATDQVTSSLRQLSDPRTPTTLNAVIRFLNYALWFLAFVWLMRLIINRFRKS